MKTRSLLLGAAASLALAGAANATHVNGWYISLEGGANWVDDVDFLAGVAVPVTPFTAEFDTGWAALGSVGYAWNNWRFEFEGGYRDNEVDTILNAVGVPVGPTPGDNSLTEVTLMVNFLYDIPLTERLSMSLGAGAGADFVNLEFATVVPPSFEDDDWVFAAQGIAGLNYAVGRQTDLYVNYRFLWVDETDFANPGGVFAFEDLSKHTATIGLRYHFGAPYVEPVAEPPPPPPPEPAATPREYIVFFGHNKANLTAEAIDVIKQAAAAAKEFGSASIQVVGHADRSGSAGYNQKLSMRRGNAVADALVAEGIARGGISVSGKGESEPMVPTDDGVREPQNRRVHISL